MESNLEFLEYIKIKNPNEPEFIQAVTEVLTTIQDTVTARPELFKDILLERLIEPERVIIFRVPWTDDKGEVQINRGYRIQFNSALGPYKGGLRFHPSVNLSILKFLAFEQTFKNALTGLPMGGGKGGSDFDPKGKSDNEVMRFCQSFMTELYKYIGPNIDVPAGDIGVGGREIGYLYGQYKRLTNESSGVLTGKGATWGGSFIRPEATGYGLIYFLREMLKVRNEEIAGKTILVSGSGNVAQYAVEKAIELGGLVVTMSDSSGFIYDPDGIDNDKLTYIKELKNVQRGRIQEYAIKYGVDYFEGEKPWSVKADIALPCATQNEIDATDARDLIENEISYVAEGANMPTTPDAIELLQNSSIVFAPGKATNAGGVAVSGLEMSQNSLRLQWTRDEVDQKLQSIMVSIHDACKKHGTNATNTSIDYLTGANTSGFIKVATAMQEQGIV